LASELDQNRADLTRSIFHDLPRAIISIQSSASEETRAEVFGILRDFSDNFRQIAQESRRMWVVRRGSPGPVRELYLPDLFDAFLNSMDHNGKEEPAYPEEDDIEEDEHARKVKYRQGKEPKKACEDLLDWFPHPHVSSRTTEKVQDSFSALKSQTLADLDVAQSVFVPMLKLTKRNPDETLPLKQYFERTHIKQLARDLGLALLAEDDQKKGNAAG